MKARIREELESLARDVVRDPESADVPGRLRGSRLPSTPEACKRFTELVQKICTDEYSLKAFVQIIPSFFESPCPEDSLLNLLRYTESVADPSTLLATLSKGKPLVEMMAVTFGSSRYMADIMIRNPGILYWLLEKSTWEREESVEDYKHDLRREASVFSSLHAKLDAARRYHRKMLLKIGVKDLMGQSSLQETTAALSDLADAIVETLLEMIWDEALREQESKNSRGPEESSKKPKGKPAAQEVSEPEGGSAAETAIDGFSVIALGKLGGRELNYSSDIDLMFVAEDVEEKKLSLFRFVAERLTEALSEATDEGYLYRVDLRLRPDGASGPLVNTLEGLRIYYETRGKPWEFQALLKARAMAGDGKTAETFLAGIAGLIFNPSLPYSPLEDISLIRARIQDHIPLDERPFNVKLMEGGIRDIEFIVQALQLIHGGKHEDIRVTGTLDAITRLADKKLLKKWEAAALGKAYAFLRLVEHRLQMMHQIKTHTVPKSGPDIEILARRVSRGPLGKFTKREFLETLTEHLNKVRIIGESFFSEKEWDDGALLLVLDEDDPRVKKILDRYSFADSKQVIHVIRAMAYGSFPKLLDRRTREALMDLLPGMLEIVSRTGNPTKSLVNIADVASASGNAGSFYRLLFEERSCLELLAAMAGVSTTMTRKLCLYPEMIERILEDPQDMLDALLKNLRRGELLEELVPKEFKSTLDIEGIPQPLVQKIGNYAAHVELSALALDIRNASFPGMLAGSRTAWILELAKRLFSAIIKEEQAALFVLGSFGTGEARISSDVDVIVIVDAGLNSSFAADVTRGVQLLNRILTESGVARLDFRLRAEGANAPLVQDLSYYEKYLETRLRPWERIALAKCRFLSGNSEIGEKFMRKISAVLSSPFKHGELLDLLRTRKKLEATRGKKISSWETRRSAGGRYDIEYLCEAATPKIPPEKRRQAGTSSEERIRRLHRAGFITSEEQDVFIDALNLFFAIEYLMELNDFSLPKTTGQRKEMESYMVRSLSLLGKKASSDLEKTLGDHKRVIRRCFDRVFARLLEE